eukprot:scaffold123014_cov53-Attheya_sp.AAC.1
MFQIELRFEKSYVGSTRTTLHTSASHGSVPVSSSEATSSTTTTTRLPPVNDPTYTYLEYVH